MRRSSAILLALLMLAADASIAQAVSPVEIRDPALRSLQQQYMDDLQRLGREIVAYQFDYPFYLSRKLGLDEAQQKRADQRSIRFEQYNGQTVLAVSGNYYAAYSGEKISSDQRARRTFLNVTMPILKAAVPRFQGNQSTQGYAVEVSHHVLGTVMGVSIERSENLMVFLPQASALRLLGSKDEAAQQAALMQGQAFLNGEPVTIWLSEEGPQSAANPPAAEASRSGPTSVSAAIIPGQSAHELSPDTASASSVSRPATPPPVAVRDTSPEALSALETSNQELVARMVADLDPQAHFVKYAAPSFIVFRQGIYLEFSLSTDLPESAGGSRYAVAALAFDEHVAHLLRPTLAYFKQEPNFDGLSFSTTVHIAGKTPSAKISEAVEFFFPFSALRCYERYDCTGQQLIDAGVVLINGERVGLDLQTAEGEPKRGR